MNSRYLSVPLKFTVIVVFFVGWAKAPTQPFLSRPRMDIENIFGRFSDYVSDFLHLGVKGNISCLDCPGVDPSLET